MADYLPLYLPGQAITAKTSADVVGGKAVCVSGSGTVANAAAAASLIVGVAAFDAKSGENVTYFGRGTVHRLAADGAVAAGAVVEAAADGVATHTQGTNDVRVFGVALTTAADGASVEIMEV